MVCQEPEAVGITGIDRPLFAEILHHSSCTILALSNTIHKMMHLPGIIHIESLLKKTYITLIFCKHQNRFNFIKFSSCSFPELFWRIMGMVNPETVGSESDPELKDIDHIIIQSLL